MNYIRIFYLLFVLVGCQVAPDTKEENDMWDTENEGNESEYDSENMEEEFSYREIGKDDWSVEVIAENLNIPWDVEVLDEEILITEREGNIVRIVDGTLTRHSVDTSDPIVHRGEGGLLGMALASDFKESRELYLYYTYDHNSSLANKVVKVVEQEGSWVEKEVLLDEIPGADIHNGGRIAIGPDSHLYVTTGDANEQKWSQNIENLAGSILRMTLDGKVPEDNLFSDSYIYSYGHRNPQGLAWDDENQLFSSEHGPTAHDELNRIESGKNYGWPVIIGEKSEEGMTSPVIHSGSDTWAPSGITFFNDHLFITGLRGGSLYVYSEEESKLHVVFTDEGRLRDVTTHNDSLYIITNNTDRRGNPNASDDRLLRLSLR